MPSTACQDRAFAWLCSLPCQSAASVTHTHAFPFDEEVLHPAVPPVQAAHEELLHRYQELKAKKMEGLQDVLAAQAAQVLTSAVCHSGDAASDSELRP
jgi:hypothetical protein